MIIIESLFRFVLKELQVHQFGFLILLARHDFFSMLIFACFRRVESSVISETRALSAAWKKIPCVSFRALFSRSTPMTWKTPKNYVCSASSVLGHKASILTLPLAIHYAQLSVHHPLACRAFETFSKRRKLSIFSVKIIPAIFDFLEQQRVAEIKTFVPKKWATV